MYSKGRWLRGWKRKLKSLHIELVPVPANKTHSFSLWILPLLEQPKNIWEISSLNTTVMLYSCSLTVGSQLKILMLTFTWLWLSPFIPSGWQVCTTASLLESINRLFWKDGRRLESLFYLMEALYCLLKTHFLAVIKFDKCIIPMCLLDY